MEQLRPKIRPKAPAALKENVLKAVSKDSLLANRQAERSSRLAATWRIALAAAAVLLLGILTFALREEEGKVGSLFVSTTPSPSSQEEGTAGRAFTTRSSQEEGTAVRHYSSNKEVSTGVPQGSLVASKQGSLAARKQGSLAASKPGSLAARKQGSLAASSSLLLGGGVRGGGEEKGSTASPHNPNIYNKVGSLLVSTTPTPSSQEEGTAGRAFATHSSQEEGTTDRAFANSSTKREETTLMSSAEPNKTLQAEQHTTPLPHREGLGGGSAVAPLSPLERQLLANFEAHRDLVNARLAEELAQARFTQERIGQTTREYLQQYLDLQKRITQQLREDIEDIAPEKNHPKEV